KYLIAASPPLYLLAAAGLTALPRPSARAVAAAAVLLLDARRLATYYSGGHERYFRMRDFGLAAALRHVAAARSPGEPLVHTSVYSYFPARFYVPGVAPQVLAAPPMPHYLLGRLIPEE